MKPKRIVTGVLSAALALGTLNTVAFAASTGTSSSTSTTNTSSNSTSGSTSTTNTSSKSTSSSTSTTNTSSKSTSSSTSTSTAKTPVTYKLQTKAIYLNGKLISKPIGFVANKTTYIPIWYVMQALDTIQMKNTWLNQTWTVQTSAGQAVDLSKISVGTGSISLKINNTLVHRVNGIPYTDPSSGQVTTFIPIWYIMQLLDRLHIDASSWDGTNWKMSTQGASGSTTTPPPVVDPNPLASSIPRAVSKGQLVMDVANALNLKPGTLPATSPFDDVAATDASYDGIEAAIADNLVTPFASTHFGAGDVVTLSDAEQLYWNYLGIQYASYQPGASMSAWASLTGLTQGVSNDQYMTTADEEQFIQNLKGLVTGEVSNGGVEQLRYTPHDEHQWTFYGNSYYLSTSAIQQAVTKTYQFYNAITMQVVGDSMQVTIPVDSDKQWFAYASSQDGIQYSTDGGATWVSADVFDGSTAGAQSPTVILKAPLADGMQITYNNMVSSVAGSVSLGWVILSDNGQGGIAVQRVTLN